MRRVYLLFQVKKSTKRKKIENKYKNHKNEDSEDEVKWQVKNDKQKRYYCQKQKPFLSIHYYLLITTSFRLYAHDCKEQNC